MPINTRLGVQDLALSAVCAALYAILCFLPISPIIGLPGKAVTAASIIAPIIGIILGPYVGTLCTTLGGIIGFFAGSFSLPSFASGIFATLCAGLLHTGRRTQCAIVYLSSLILLGFFPHIGPAWLFPESMWLQVAGFLILISPLQSIVLKSLESEYSPEFPLAFFATSLVSTLAGQMAGSVVFEFVFAADATGWKAVWQGLTFLYPLERMLIALGSTWVGVPLFRILKSMNLKHTLTYAGR